MEKTKGKGGKERCQKCKYIQKRVEIKGRSCKIEGIADRGSSRPVLSRNRKIIMENEPYRILLYGILLGYHILPDNLLEEPLRNVMGM